MSQYSEITFQHFFEISYNNYHSNFEISAAPLSDSTDSISFPIQFSKSICEYHFQRFFPHFKSIIPNIQHIPCNDFQRRYSRHWKVWQLGSNPRNNVFDVQTSRRRGVCILTRFPLWLADLQSSPSIHLHAKRNGQFGTLTVLLDNCWINHTPLNVSGTHSRPQSFRGQILFLVQLIAFTRFNEKMSDRRATFSTCSRKHSV